MNAVPPTPVALPEDLTPLQRDVLQALAVLTGHRQRAVIHKFLQAASWLTDKGRPPPATRCAARSMSWPHRAGWPLTRAAAATGRCRPSCTPPPG
ncbi:hypothetical protein ACU6VJ_10575 [Sphaerotilus sulfidivorans]